MPARLLLPSRHARGFTLIELMVTVTLLSILMALAFPSMGAWLRNSRVRAASESLQNGLRLAQAEALRRSRQVVFSLTTNTTPQAGGFTATANGTTWSINTVPLLTDETAQFVEGGVLTSVAADVAVTGPAAICFNSLGRIVANPAPGTGAACTATTGQSYNVNLNPTAERPLRLLVELGGQVRMCDPAKALASYPDGCP